MGTPQQSIESFQHLATSLDELVRRCGNTKLDPHDMMIELRELAAVAGARLINLIDQGLLIEPAPSPFWIAVARESAKLNFERVFLPGPDEIDRGAARSVAELRHLCLCAQEHFEGYEAEEMERAWKPFVHRQVFFEAISTWLYEQWPGALVPIRLWPWRGRVSADTFVSFTSDWIERPWRRHEFELALPLARQCRDAAERLARIQEAGVMREPPWTPESQRCLTNTLVASLATMPAPITAETDDQRVPARRANEVINNDRLQQPIAGDDHRSPAKETAEPKNDGDEEKIWRRLSTRQAELAIGVLGKLRNHHDERLTSAQLDSIGVPSKTVYSASRNWKCGTDYFGARTASCTFTTSRVVAYVIEQWTPKPKRPARTIG